MNDTVNNSETVAMPYNANPDLTKMREDIADRNYNITMKAVAITGAAFVLGAIAGALALPALLMGGATAGAFGAMSVIVGGFMGGTVAAMGGGIVSQMMTMKESKQLEIDEEMVNSYMSGKNYWGEGYRKEVAEHGYSLGGTQHAENVVHMRKQHADHEHVRQ